MEKDLEHMVCPEGHSIPLMRETYAKYVSGDVDCNGVPMYEDGLYCYICDKAYGLSKLERQEEPKK